jgi:hypothetical protein
MEGCPLFLAAAVVGRLVAADLPLDCRCIRAAVLRAGAGVFVFSAASGHLGTRATAVDSSSSGITLSSCPNRSLLSHVARSLLLRPSSHQYFILSLQNCLQQIISADGRKTVAILFLPRHLRIPAHTSAEGRHYPLSPSPPRASPTSKKIPHASQVLKSRLKEEKKTPR